jgi:hypothetical protein
MNIKLDENLPLRLATQLKDVGHDVQTVHDERLVGHSDIEIWQAAEKESRFLNRVCEEERSNHPERQWFLAREFESVRSPWHGPFKDRSLPWVPASVLM